MKETTSRDRYHARRKTKTYLRICGDRISLRYCWVYHITQSHRSGLLWSMLAWVNLPSIYRYIPNYIYIYILGGYPINRWGHEAHKLNGTRLETRPYHW